MSALYHLRDRPRIIKDNGDCDTFISFFSGAPHLAHLIHTLVLSHVKVDFLLTKALKCIPQLQNLIFRHSTWAYDFTPKWEDVLGPSLLSISFQSIALYPGLGSVFDLLRAVPLLTHLSVNGIAMGADNGNGRAPIQTMALESLSISRAINMLPLLCWLAATTTVTSLRKLHYTIQHLCDVQALTWWFSAGGSAEALHLTFEGSVDDIRMFQFHPLRSKHAIHELVITVNQGSEVAALNLIRYMNVPSLSYLRIVLGHQSPTSAYTCARAPESIPAHLLAHVSRVELTFVPSIRTVSKLGHARRYFTWPDGGDTLTIDLDGAVEVDPAPWSVEDEYVFDFEDEEDEDASGSIYDSD
jgi:hypothetical protein